jgi:conjugal transfer pilus assembly protein TraB
MPAGPPTTGPLVTPVQAGKPTAVPAATQKLRVIEVDRHTIAAKYWLPTGTIVPVRLLSGLDAPTGAGGGAGSGAASNPHPVLMEVTDWAKLPNETTIDAVGCFMLGEGIGDISMERAMIRALGLSCVKADGVAVDLPVKGVVTGEDGKVGLRGRIVMRESALLARALMTGFIGGISRAFMPFQMGFVVAPGLSQAMQLPNPQQVGLAGMAGGMQQAASLLAQHYAQMAARIYPVIEVDAGRWADLIVTEGRELTGEVK